MDSKLLKEYDSPAIEICSFDLSVKLCESSGGKDEWNDTEW